MDLRRATKVKSALTKGPLAAALKAEPFLGYVEFYPTAAEAVAYKDTDDPTGGLQSRAKGADYAGGDDDLNKTPGSSAVKLLGLPVAIDKLEMQTHMDIPALKTSKMLSVARNFGPKLAAKMHNGTGAGNELPGFPELVDAGFDIALATNGLDLNTAANVNIFFRLLDQYIAEVNPQVITMNPLMWSFFQEKARERHALTWDKNEFGIPVSRYALVPIIPIRQAGITQTETQGTSEDCTSIYMLRFAELDDVCFHTTVGLDVTDIQMLDNEVIKKGNMELYGIPVRYKKDSIVRLKGARFV